MKEGQQRGETCRGGRGRRRNGRELFEGRSHSPRLTRASRVCSVWGQAEVKSASPRDGHVSRAIEDLTVVLPV